MISWTSVSAPVLNLTIAGLLSSFGSNQRVERDRPRPMLTTAAASGNLRLVEWLLANGADRNRRLENGETALDRTRSESFGSG